MDLIENLLKFGDLEWDKPHVGVEQKFYSDGKTRIRLLRFYDDFVEEHWCTKGHIGYVLDGEMTIDFNGELKNYQKGDGLWIVKGEQSKHKVLIEKGKHVELLLFEPEE